MIEQHVIPGPRGGAVMSGGQLAAPPLTHRRPLVRGLHATAGRQYVQRLLDGSILARLMIAMCCVVVALLLYLAQASQASVLEYQLADLQQQELQLNMQNANLAAQATALQSVGRIDTVASNQLHMVPPDPSHILWLRPVVPLVPSSPPDEISARTAERQSEPLTWMRHFVSFVKSSL